jgi:hypothetical protein
VSQNDRLAHSFVEKGRPLAQAAGDALSIAWLLHTQAALAAAEGRFNEILRDLGEAVRLLEGSGDAPGVLRLLRRQYATTLVSLGRLDESTRLHEQNLHEARSSADWDIGSAVLLDLGTIAVLQGHLDCAASHFTEGLQLAIRVGSPMVLHWSLDALATIAARQERPRRAGFLVGAADKLRGDLAFTGPLTQRLYQRLGFGPAMAAARAQLGDSEFDSARRTGATLSVGEILAVALESGDPE